MLCENLQFDKYKPVDFLVQWHVINLKPVAGFFFTIHCNYISVALFEVFFSLK